MADSESSDGNPSDGNAADDRLEIVDLRTVGILGGMSSQATAEYYRLLNEGVNEALGEHNAAEVLISSVNFQNVERCIRQEEWDLAASYLVEKARNLEAGGADFVVMATNPMHKVAPQLSDALGVPFVHIVDVAADAIADAGLDTVGLLGTRETMEMPFYRERFDEHGIDVVVPDAAARERADEIIFEELVRDVVTEDSRERYVDCMESMVEDGAEAIVLGCTEIELLVSQDDFPGTPLFDTTALHVDRTVELSLTPDEPIESLEP
jgi:aspartate racemase